MSPSVPSPNAPGSLADRLAADFAIDGVPPWLEDSNQSIAYALHWSEAFQELMAQLDEELLLDVLAGASSRLRDHALSQLGLDVQWRNQKRRSTSTSGALRGLLPQLRRALQTKRRMNFGPGVLFLTWWGRVAVEWLGAVPLGAILSEQKLLDRFPKAVAWLLDASEYEVEPVAAQLGLLEDSPDARARIFSGLLKCAYAGLHSLAVSAAIPDWLKPQGAKPAKAEPPPPPPISEPPPRTTAPEEGKRPPEPVVALPEEKPAPMLAPELPAQEPMAPLPVADPIPEPAGPEQAWAAITRLEALLSESQQLVMEASEALSRADFQRVGEIAKAGNDSRGRVEVKLRELAQLFMACEAGTPPSLPDAAFNDPAVSAAFLEAIREQLREVERRREREFQEFKQTVAVDFEAVGLEPPLKLHEARTRAEVIQVRESWSRRLSDERLFQELLTSAEEAGEIFKKTLPRERLEFYQRVFSASQREFSPRFPGALLQDIDALTQDPSSSRRLFASAVQHLLDAGLQLPENTWILLSRLSDGRVASALSELGIEELLAVTPPDLINLKELHQALGSEGLDKLLPELRQLLERVTASQLPPAMRLRSLAELALQSREPTILAELFSTLLEAEQSAEAMLLAILAAHAGAPVPEEAVSEALRRFTVAIVDRDDHSRELVQFCLQDASWLTHAPDDVAILLYLVVQTGFKAPYINLQYLAPDALRAAGRARPALVSRWLQPEAEAESASGERERRQLALSEARQALQEWDLGLKKKSCWSNWPPAVDYQLYFNQWLGKAMASVEAGSPPPPMEPDDLISDAMSKKALPEVEGDAVKQMREYLTRQHQRLQAMYEALPYLHEGGLREALSHLEPDLRSDLEEELRRLGGSPAIHHIYQRAIERA